jgi:cobalt/nickel transport system ATP-binding protein
VCIGFVMDTILTVTGLHYTYANGVKALDGVSFALNESERLAIVGGNGAGKTTLILHLNGTVRGDGTVTVYGHTIGESPIKDVRRVVGVLFQDSDDQLFMPTVIEDVAFGLLNAGFNRDGAKAKAVEALEAMDAVHLMDREPSELSVGEKKRVALAAILALEPPIIAFDEPAAGLDPQGRRKLMGIIGRLDAGIVIATHDLELALELCDRALVITQGKVIAGGTPADLFIDPLLMGKSGLEVPCSITTGTLRKSVV